MNKKDLTTRADMFIVQWIKHNHYQKEFGSALDVNEFKRLVSKKLFGDEKPDEKFIKGAKLINWEAIYKILKKLYSNTNNRLTI